MKKRYSDLIRKNKVDFIFRPHDRIISLLVATIFYSFFMVLFNHITPLSLTYPISSTAIYLIFIIFKIKKNSNILHNTEFQNALFANSLKKDTEFFLIIKEDQSLVYNDERSGVMGEDLTEFFADFTGKEKKLLSQAIANKSRCNLECSSHKFLSGIEIELLPLNRPDGYFILKGTRKSKEKIYTEIMESHVVGSYVLNADGLLLSGNRSFLDLIEVSNIKEKLMYFPQLIDPKDTAELTTFLGNTVSVYVTSKLNSDSTGDQYIYGLVTPEDFQRSEFLEAPIPIAQFDNQGRFLKYNNTFSTLVAKKPTSIFDLGKEKIDVNLYCSQTSNVSSQLTLADGRIMKIFVKFSGKNNITVFFFDITQYKKIEEQLLHSQKVHSIGELAGGIAHDFNNILTAIIGFCDLILTRSKSRNQTFADVMQIKQNSERATHLVSKLLAFSRRQTLELEVLEIPEMLDGVFPLIKRLIGTNISLKINYLHDVGRVKADKRQLEQVVMNLTINSRDAIEKDTGGIIITVSKELITGDIDDMVSADPDDNIIPGEYVVMKFADDGSGIPKDILSKIFDPFFSTKKEGEGTGLGLSTVYGIIRQIGGYIYIKSEVGVGTQINIYLHKVYEKITKVRNEIVKQPEQISFTEKNILLVEDEGPIRIFLKRALSREGYTVYDYSSSTEAIENLTDEKKIDIILTDIIMPEIGGVGLVKRIKETIPGIQVIFISGYSKQKLKDVEYTYHFLQKPFSLEEIISKINKVSSL